MATKEATNDPLANLQEDFAPGWRPSDGDKVVGTVTDISRGWSDQTDSYYPIVTVYDENKNEKVAIHCFHAILQNKMKELKPAVGERIGVILIGERPTKDGKRTMKVYNINWE